jgi:hypothetical protein
MFFKTSEPLPVACCFSLKVDVTLFVGNIKMPTASVAVSDVFSRLDLRCRFTLPEQQIVAFYRILRSIHSGNKSLARGTVRNPPAVVKTYAQVSSVIVLNYSTEAN